MADGYATDRPPIHPLILERALGLLPEGFPRRAEALPLRGSSVDLIVAAGALDFVDLRAALAELGRILVRDGNVVVYDFGAARRFRSSDEFAQWYSVFLDRYPPAIDSRQPVTRDALASCRDVLTLSLFENFDVDLVLSSVEYTNYLMTQTNVASAVWRGESYDAIRSWCRETLDRFFLGPTPVVFDGYIAHLTRT